MPSQPNQTWQNRAELSIAHGALTSSKRPECLVKGVYPTHLVGGRGAHVTDTNGRSYIDFIAGLGSNILGYGHTEIVAAVADRARIGATLSLGTDLEVECAEKVKELIPFIDRIRFLKTGSDACNAAIRIARAYTKRPVILSEGYHGWADEFVSLTPPALGVNKSENIDKLDNWDAYTPDRIAAVIVEPIVTDASKERIEWLKKLRERCTKSGTLLIFDEVITGFRYPKFCASRYYGVEPDLICLGKALGNGMPISVVGGKREVMECGEWFVSSTFAGETLSLASALKTMTLLQTKYSLEDLWLKGDQFLKSFNSFWPEKIWIEGYPTRGAFRGDDMVKALFWQEACLSGILFGPSWFFNFHHVPQMEAVLNTCKDIITRIQTGSVQLKGHMPKSPFSAKVRGNS